MFKHDTHAPKHHFLRRASRRSPASAITPTGEHVDPIETKRRNANTYAPGHHFLQHVSRCSPGTTITLMGEHVGQVQRKVLGRVTRKQRLTSQQIDDTALVLMTFEFSYTDVALYQDEPHTPYAYFMPIILPSMRCLCHCLSNNVDTVKGGSLSFRTSASLCADSSLENQG